MQSAAPAVRQWYCRSFPYPKHHLSKCPERDHRHHTVFLTITDSTSTTGPVSAFSISSVCATPTNPTSSAELFPGPTDLPAAATTPESKSAITANKFPILRSNTPPSSVPLPDADASPSTSASSPSPVSSPTLQIHLLWLLVPASLLSSSELLLGAWSESPAFCAPPSCPLRYYHSQ